MRHPLPLPIDFGPSLAERVAAGERRLRSGRVDAVHVAEFHRVAQAAVLAAGWCSPLQGEPGEGAVVGVVAEGRVRRGRVRSALVLELDLHEGKMSLTHDPSQEVRSAHGLGVLPPTWSRVVARTLWTGDDAAQGRLAELARRAGRMHGDPMLGVGEAEAWLAWLNGDRGRWTRALLPIARHPNPDIRLLAVRLGLPQLQPRERRVGA